MPSSGIRPVVHLWRLGRMRFDPALRVQQGLAKRLKEASARSRRTGVGRAEAESEHVLLAVEHPPVYTTGIRRGEHDSKREEDRLRSLGAEFARADRGGLLTFHGPGQLVLYPVLDLKHFVPQAAARKALLGNGCVTFCL